ncbi:hypothetical protein [Planococcus sp. CAU13]|uniref:hypothetical protein n=1 Tax=Planococcus sp. CAU13 TaxID=1541197 RepID=UPI0005300356|nr:hypothetical protein [Planococcus sp. CAU13]
MKISEEKKVFLVMLLSIAAAIYVAMDIMQQVQAGYFPYITSLILLGYAVSIIVALLLSLKRELNLEQKMNKAIELRGAGQHQQSNVLIVELVNNYPEDAEFNFQCAWSIDSSFQ